jgi:hypothetical protein
VGCSGGGGGGGGVIQWVGLELGRGKGGSGHWSWVGMGGWWVRACVDRRGELGKESPSASGVDGISSL